MKSRMAASVFGRLMPSAGPSYKLRLASSRWISATTSARVRPTGTPESARAPGACGGRSDAKLLTGSGAATGRGLTLKIGAGCGPGCRCSPLTRIAPAAPRHDAERDRVAGIAAESVRHRSAPERALLLIEAIAVGRRYPIGFVEINHASPRTPGADAPRPRLSER